MVRDRLGLLGCAQKGSRHTLKVFKILLRIIQSQNHRKRKALRRAEIHYREAKTLQNHEKTKIAGLTIQMHNSISI